MNQPTFSHVPYPKDFMDIDFKKGKESLQG